MSEEPNSDTSLAAQLEEFAEAFFRGHRWAPMRNRSLVGHIRSRFTEVFLEKSDLPPEMAPRISRNLHVGVGKEGNDSFVLAVFFGTGSAYFYYEDPTDSQLMDRWITEMAELQVENFETELGILGLTGPELLE